MIQYLWFQLYVESMYVWVWQVVKPNTPKLGYMMSPRTYEFSKQ
jgi:hypothetical protein